MWASLLTVVVVPQLSVTCRLRYPFGRVDGQPQRRDGQAAPAGAADGLGVEADRRLACGQMQAARARDRHLAVGVVLVQDEGVQHQRHDEADDCHHQGQNRGQNENPRRRPSASHSRSLSRDDGEDYYRCRHVRQAVGRARVERGGSTRADRQRDLHRQFAAAGRRIASGDSAFRAGRRSRSRSPARRSPSSSPTTAHRPDTTHCCPSRRHFRCCATGPAPNTRSSSCTPMCRTTTSPCCSRRWPTIRTRICARMPRPSPRPSGGRSTARSFPSNSVHLGWSSWAIQWLSRVPAPIPDHVQVAYSADEGVRTAYAKQAAHDWHEFVAFRGRELCPGGQLVVLTMALDERRRVRLPAAARRPGRHAGRTDRRRPAHRRRSASHVPADRRATRRRTSWPRSRRPAGSSGCPIEHLEVFNAEDRFWTQYQVDHDANAFGALWAAFVRASVFPTLATALAERPQRPPVAGVLRPAGDRHRRSAGRRAGADADPVGQVGADETTEDEMTLRAIATPSGA